MWRGEEVEERKGGREAEGTERGWRRGKLEKQVERKRRKEEVERKADEEVERKADEEVERKADEEVERKADEEVERKADEEEERKADEEEGDVERRWRRQEVERRWRGRQTRRREMWRGDPTSQSTTSPSTLEDPKNLKVNICVNAFDCMTVDHLLHSILGILAARRPTDARGRLILQYFFMDFIRPPHRSVYTDLTG
ncbi:unnamed protein product [Merluccius merluccius]